MELLGLGRSNLPAIASKLGSTDGGLLLDEVMLPWAKRCSKDQIGNVPSVDLESTARLYVAFSPFAEH